jgi:glycogen synthase
LVLKFAVRIVHVADSFAPDVGGIEFQVERLARRQRLDGHDVTVITAVAEPSDTDLDLHVVRATSGRWLTVAFPWRNHRAVAQVLDGSPIDVVHAHFTVISPMAIYVTRAASRRGIPVAVTVHSLWWKVAVATRLCTLPFGWGRMRAAWSAVSTVAAGHVDRTLLGVGEVSVTPNLVDTTWWRRHGPMREATGEIDIVLVGRLKKRKHVNEFIDALAEARRRLPAEHKVTTRVKVSILGEGPRRADLERQITMLDLSDWVSLIGYRPAGEIRDLFHSSDLFVASSRQEAFGMAALEARAAGLPVIGYFGNGLKDFVTNGVDGILVSDAEDLTRTLVDLIGQPERLRSLQRTAASSPPAVVEADAMKAVDDLYARAQAMHQTAACPNDSQSRAPSSRWWSSRNERRRSRPVRQPR